MEVITLAGGCFWCTEAVFSGLKGVVKVTPGYSGGTTPSPSYSEVSSGETGHAEAVQIEFDPKTIKLDELLYVFFKLHDPTQVNRQGNDIGTQYRSVIFYRDEKQREQALKSKENLEKEGVYKDSIVTQIVPSTKFYEAENYHKDYFDKNKNYPYCRFVINPKVQKLMEKYENDVKEEYKN